MRVATFDTYAAAKTLREAGFNEGQAEAAVAMVRDAVTEGVATKADIAALKADLAALKAELTWRMVILDGVVIAAVKLIP